MADEPEHETNPDYELPKIEQREGWYPLLTLATFAVYALVSVLFGLLGLGVVLFSLDIPFLGPLNFNLGMPILLLVLAHFVLSLRKVETSQIAGMYFYGTPLKVAQTGLNFVPLGIMQLVVYPADLQEILEPGSREEIFWGDEELPLPNDKKVRPIWLPTKAPNKKEEGEDDAGPLDAQMVVGVSYHVFWRIVDPFAFDAYVGDEKEAEKQLKLISVRALGEEIVQFTAGEAVEQQEKINKQLDNRIRKATKHWGITIPNAGLEQINLSHELGGAMRDRAMARFKKQTQQILADGEAYEREKIGLADAVVLQAKEAAPLKGRAEGIAEVAKVMKDNSEAAGVFAADMTRETLERANVIFAGGEAGLKDLMAAATAMKTAIEPKQKPKEDGDGSNS